MKKTIPLDVLWAVLLPIAASARRDPSEPPLGQGGTVDGGYSPPNRTVEELMKLDVGDELETADSSALFSGNEGKTPALRGERADSRTDGRNAAAKGLSLPIILPEDEAMEAVEGFMNFSAGPPRSSRVSGLTVEPTASGGSVAERSVRKPQATKPTTDELPSSLAGDSRKRRPVKKSSKVPEMHTAAVPVAPGSSSLKVQSRVSQKKEVVERSAQGTSDAQLMKVPSEEATGIPEATVPVLPLVAPTDTPNQILFPVETDVSVAVLPPPIPSADEEMTENIDILLNTITGDEGFFGGNELLDRRLKGISKDLLENVDVSFLVDPTTEYNQQVSSLAPTTVDQTTPESGLLPLAGSESRTAGLQNKEAEEESDLEFLRNYINDLK